ncbi:uncharacterized protein J4E84_010255 [Alternaria hordeiaustralica]|uniref:uncharacterized protein n=1 Tax=Alternaria hordeiaustralica TaxID=1187925 RepID=UPI0020C3FB81|nr:uncharacterized protein J4E84_010255 [Alternaria hordeiaustralica]KAI4675254.1 hypothetical protein J4E84_010255 [Alternaria hordeiaustralica]
MASDMLSSTSNLTLWETISARLPALNTANKVSEGTTTTALRYNHIGRLEKWDIKPELARFKKAITPVFDAYSAGPNKKRHSAQPESLKVAAEIDLDGRVKDNLVAPVHETLHELQNQEHGMATPLLPTNFQYSSAKGYHKDLRPKGHEPDLVIEVADLKGNKRVRIVGEFKSCTACDIESMIKEPWSHNAKSFCNLLAFDVKYGFVSTYNQTVFLKIERSVVDPSQMALFYSEIFYDTDSTLTTSTIGKNDTQTFGTSFGFLYLLHLVAGEDEETWKLNRDDIPDPNEWFFERSIEKSFPKAVIAGHRSTRGSSITPWARASFLRQDLLPKQKRCKPAARKLKRSGVKDEQDGEARTKKSHQKVIPTVPTSNSLNVSRGLRSVSAVRSNENSGDLSAPVGTPPLGTLPLRGRQQPERNAKRNPNYY